MSSRGPLNDELHGLHMLGFDGETLDEAWADVERCAYLGNDEAWQMLRIPLPTVPPGPEPRDWDYDDAVRLAFGDALDRDLATARDIEVSEP